MNKIINFSLKNKFAVWLLTIIVTIAGIYSGLNMKLETIPDITTPVVTVTTVYPGATPEEVADKVSKPMEEQLQNLSGVNVVSSSSFQNASSIQVEYDFDKNMEKAETEIKEALANVKLPEGVKDPKVSRVNFNAFPVISLSVASKNESLATLTENVEKNVVPGLKGLDGVASVQISGQQVDEVQLVFKKDKMKELGLSEDTVKNVIKGSDVSLPLGLYTFKDTEKSVVVDGNITTMKALKELKIPAVPSSASGQGSQTAGTGAQMPQMNPAAMNGIPTVTLDEIADIKEVGKAESISRTNGKEAIGIQIVKAADANTVDVVNAVKDKVKELEKKYKDLEIISTFDQGAPIEKSVETMLSKAIFGAIFAIVIIMLFLRNIRTTLISVVSIPLSLLIAVLVIKQMDITLNIMTLGAMTVAIGRVVDDSIVVIENIYRRMSLSGEKLRGKDLIREATKEMFIPIMSSTIVTIAVFLPLGLVKGMIGEMFLPFALTIVFALLASLLVAVTIVPMLAHSLFKKESMREKEVHHEEKPSKLANGYKRILAWALNHKIITSSIAVLLLVGSLALVPIIGVSFLPSEEEKMIIATYNPEPGQTLEDVEKIATKAEKHFQDNKDVKTIQFSLGGENPMSPGQSNQAMFFVQYDNDTKNFEKEKEQVVKDLQKMSGKGEWKNQDFGASSGSNEIKLYVYGDSSEDIKPVVKDIQNIMKKNKDLKDIDSSIAKTYAEYTLVADQEKLSKMGLTAAQIGMGLSNQHDRPVLTTIKKDGKDINVYVEAEKQNYETIDDLTNRKITTPLGNEVAVKDVMTVKEGETSNTVKHRDGRVYAEVSAKLTSDDVSKASAAVQKEVDKMDLPSGVDVSMGGVTKDIEESFKQLGLAMLAAIAIVYFVLVVTFGGALAPFAILFSLPFTIIGALVALLISGETLSVSAMIGALMLIGIVVTNAIVLIDRVIHKENEGLSTREALLEAGATRLRPILMTAIATIGALIPLALGFEGSGLISKGLGVTVIGGLTSSTLLTLLIVPIVYEVLSKFKKKKVK
ncbi:efflux RND transporter permease subunit [Bacillus paranthracis]|uniref:Efflux RND transporter permease subunit n=1 Tax=Bacillus paranthracis TaxID=2026186 RepID=A0AAJ1NHV2_9BACI|nr:MULTISPECIES: efflux RND transporter permease subunit [Bacillus]ADY24644.1 transporter, AcrB/AcrD/AcrF family protein [Bacillus thuringiensis serovar finitimus YBT-020]MCW4574416.1 efflux RND transporter permease subunit [Bacillus pacificus]MDA1586276.1 efflux RND transporter permease subunit [Bacillus cereus group sp. TH230-1LC]MRC71960.1 MMPL family transporter [Bacillus thuringiensis]OTX73304.1 Swarming motility protein SwrC [Bacillus thuringiensis serovar finitimus]